MFAPRPYVRLKATHEQPIREKPSPKPAIKKVVSNKASNTTHAPKPNLRPATKAAPAKSAPTSNPMSIPTKKKVAPRKDSTTQKPKESTPLPASVAALLASTSIPKRRTSVRSLPRKISVEKLREEWKNDKLSISTPKGSPLDLLLQSDEDDIEIEENDDEIIVPSRSMSCDSMLSTPSLDQDEPSVASSYSFPRTPSIAASLRRPIRVERKVSSPPITEVNHHPLLEEPIMERESATPISFVPIRTTKVTAAATASTRSSLKSNLSMSFSRLRSAAKSFSNFTAPSLPSDDFLTRSLFSTRYAPEMRPSFKGTADPALRRYLNPPTSVSLDDAHYALTDSSWVNGESDDHNMRDSRSIMMVSYARLRSPSRNKKRSLSPTPSEFENDLAVMPRQREPRENSDFLRVIVLEMNMRRSGKLDAKVGGHARVWLPPRSETAPPVDELIGGKIPSRWIGVTIDEI